MGALANPELEGVTWRYGGYRRLADNGRPCHISSQTMGVRSPDKRDYIRSSGSPTSISGRQLSEVGATQIDAGGMRPELEADAGLTLTAGGLVLAEARNEEYSRISPAAGLALLGAAAHAGWAAAVSTATPCCDRELPGTSGQ